MTVIRAARHAPTIADRDRRPISPSSAPTKLRALWLGGLSPKPSSRMTRALDAPSGRHDVTGASRGKQTSTSVELVETGKLIDRENEGKTVWSTESSRIVIGHHLATQA